MFKHIRSNLLIFIPLLLLAVGLFFTFVLSQQSQETRSRASSSDVKLSLTTSSKEALKPLDTVPVSVLIDTNGKKVGKLVLELTYPKNSLSVTAFNPGTFFPKSSNKSIKDGVAKMTFVEDCTGNACVGLGGAGIIATLQVKVDKDAPNGEATLQINKKSDLSAKNKKATVPYAVKNLKLDIKGKAKPKATPTVTPEVSPEETPLETPEPTLEDTPVSTLSGTITPSPTPQATSSAVTRNGFPDTFVWVANPTSSFTSDEREFIAHNYSVIIINNGHANWDMEKVHTDAKALKAINPDLEIYPYFSASFRFDKDTYGKPSFKSQWYLKDKNKKKLSNQKGAADYVDLSKKAYRTWAVGIIKDWMTKAPYSGILLDDVDQIGGKKKQWANKLTKKYITDWNNGLTALVSEVQQAIGDKHVIFNGIAGNENAGLLTNADSAVNDDFCFNRAKATFDTEKDIMDSVKLMIAQAGKGKTIFEKVNYEGNKGKTKAISDDLVLSAGRFCFGAFLLGSDPGKTFFKFGPGYSTSIGEILINSPEATLALGLPKSSYEPLMLEAADEEDTPAPTEKDKKKDKKKHKKKDPKKKAKPKKDAIAYRRLFDNGWVLVNAGNVPFTTSVPERLTVGNGGVIGEVYEPEDLITIPVHDAIFLVKDNAFENPPPPPETCIPGDLDCDGHVDEWDYNELVSNFGRTGTHGFIPSDIDKSGEVDIFDYDIVVFNWTEPVLD